MRIIHTDGFPVTERKEVRQVIFSNLIVAFKIIAEEMRDLGIEYANPESEVVKGITNLISCTMLKFCRNSRLQSCLPMTLVSTTRFLLGVCLL